VGLTTFPRQRDRRAPHVEIADVTGEDERHHLRNRINASKAPAAVARAANFGHVRALRRNAKGRWRFPLFRIVL
jgi:hypothetical protein